jgi:hypothetical protein
LLFLPGLLPCAYSKTYTRKPTTTFIGKKIKSPYDDR